MDGRGWRGREEDGRKKREGGSVRGENDDEGLTWYINSSMISHNHLLGSSTSIGSSVSAVSNTISCSQRVSDESQTSQLTQNEVEEVTVVGEGLKTMVNGGLWREAGDTHSHTHTLTHSHRHRLRVQAHSIGTLCLA